MAGNDLEGIRERKARLAEYYKQLAVRMKSTSYTNKTLTTALEMSISHVALKCFDITAFLSRLNRVKRIPKDLSHDAV